MFTFYNLFVLKSVEVLPSFLQGNQPHIFVTYQWFCVYSIFCGKSLRLPHGNTCFFLLTASCTVTLTGRACGAKRYLSGSFVTNFKLICAYPEVKNTWRICRWIHFYYAWNLRPLLRHLLEEILLTLRYLGYTAIP